MNRAMLIFSLLVLSQVLFGQTEGLIPMKDTASFKQQLDKVSKATFNIQSDFVQEKNLSVLEEKIITSGKFYFKAPSKLRWEYLDPFEYLIILNGQNVLIKDGEHVSKYDTQTNKIFKEINDLMIELVQGNVLNNGKYKANYFENGQLYVLDLIPHAERMRAYLSDIFIYIDKGDYSVSEIKMLESSGDYTRISFTGKKINQQIADEVFVIH